MHISTKGINAFAKQTKVPAKEFKLKHSFHPGWPHKIPPPGKLIDYSSKSILIWKEIGEGLLPMSQKLRSSLLKQASERQISSLRWVSGAAFWNPWKPDPPCLWIFSLMTLSWVGSRVPAPSINEWWIFSKAFFFIYWDYHMLSIFQVYHIDWFAHIESLHSWNKPKLIMVYEVFDVLLNSLW